MAEPEKEIRLLKRRLKTLEGEVARAVTVLVAEVKTLKEKNGRIDILENVVTGQTDLLRELQQSGRKK